jgi:biopolymer transport protein ExbB/TolQ
VSVPLTKSVEFSWSRQDIEQKLFFRGGRFTQVNTFLSGLLGLLLTVGVYIVLLSMPDSIFTSKLVGQGPIPYAIVGISMWCLAILFLKWRKLRFQNKTLGVSTTPDQTDFILSARTADQVLDRMYEIVDDPKHFVLFNRISIALANLRNIGRVSDVDEILRSQADHDDAMMNSTYTILGGFVWAIPILGFIGTVLGLSVAIGQFSSVIQESSGDTSKLLAALQDVTGGLGTAFDTTLEALVAALIIQMLMTFLRKSEQEFMDKCTEYCVHHVVNRLRIMPYQQDADE